MFKQILPTSSIGHVQSSSERNMHFDSQSTSHLNLGRGRSQKENLNQLIGRKLELLITLNAIKDDPARGQ